jgi:C-terminal processing protease CtpA/Prc
MEPYFRMNSDTSSIFKGRVFILQGDRTYSSAGMFVTAAQDNRIGTVVGRSSTYRPSHFGDLLRWRLPNTGTCGFLSHKIFHRPDLSKDTEAALEPDIPVNPDMEDIMSGADPYEECILKLL